MGKIGNLFNNEDLDIKDVLDQYESMQLKNKDEESLQTKNVDDKTKPIKIDLEDRNEDTPNSYIKNNKTIVLDKDNEHHDSQNRAADNDNVVSDDAFITFNNANPNTADSNANKHSKTFKTVSIENLNKTNQSIAANQQKLPTQEFDNIDLETVGANLDKKTRILFNEPQASDKKDLTREINDAENIIIEDKNTKDAKKEARKLAKTERLALKKSIHNKLPKFVRFELFNNKFKLFLTTFGLLCSIGGLSYLAYAGATAALSFYLFIPFGLIAIVILCIFVASLMNSLSLKKELKLLNYDVDNEKPLSTIKKIYRHLITANINLNWICASVYVLSGFAVLITYIVTYFINLTAHNINQFGLLSIANADVTPAICMWTFVGVAGFMLIFQIIYNFVNRKRRNDIEIFYKEEIFPEELQIKMRKSANLRGGIIFAITTVFVGFIVAIVYFVLKRKPQKIIQI